MTFETILKRALDMVPSSVDKREGSMVYDALAPAAMELSRLYVALDIFLEESFADTASTQYLIKRAAERGMEMELPTKAVLRGEFNQDIPIGSRFSLDELNYTAVERIAANTYKMECESAGAMGNGKTGTLIPIEYIPGLTKAELTEILVSGTDLEDTEHFRQRYFNLVQKPSVSGNRYHYEQWASEVAGVGKAKALALWDGPGTVKVLVTDQEENPAEQALLDQVAVHIETVRPIGAGVTVAAPTAKPIQISATVELSQGTYLDAVKQQLKEDLNRYLKSLVFQKNVVSYAVIGGILLDVAGVADYTNLLVCGGTANIKLGGEEIAVLGTVEVSA